MDHRYGIDGLLSVAMAALLAGCVTARENSPQHFDNLIQWFTGDWDNGAQVAREQRGHVAEFDRHLHYAMTYVPISTPALEGQVFAIKSYNEGGFEGPLSRVGLHRFVPSAQTNEIVHEFLFLREPERWGDLKTDLSALSALALSDVRINENCRMYWRWEGDHFVGQTRVGQCITSSYTETKILVEGHGELRPGLLIRHDQNFELSGEIRPRQGGSSAEIFQKVQR